MNTVRAPLRLQLCALLLIQSSLGSASPLRCEGLTSLKLTDGLIASARAMTAPAIIEPAVRGPAIKVPASFCRVTVTLKPTPDSDIKMEVWLPPAHKWNGKFEGVGNGGLGGTIPLTDMIPGLLRGYAVAADDTGHEDPSGGGSFALGHPQKVIDYGWRATHLTAVVGQNITKAYYGRPPAHDYFSACSLGGGEALMEAQQFPEDYDGIIAGDPMLDQTHHEVGAHLWIPLALSAPGSMLTPEKAALLGHAVNQACDAMDGVKDGVLEDPRQCRFDPGVLLCKGADGPDCLTAPQVEAVRKIWAGPRQALGPGYYPGLEPGGESETWKMWIVAKSPADDIHSMLGLPFFRYFVYGDPHWDPRRFNFKTDPQRIDRMLAMTLDASNPDLGPFERRGGKLIQYHGYSDPDISPLSSIDYYQAVVQKLGRPRVESFYRLFMVPGMGHCGGGPGANKFDMLPALEAWVEHDLPPVRIVATKYQDDDPRRRVVRTHPLCPFPQTAWYKGVGNTNDANNFACRSP
jgi:feruloyl esterase